jgi:hypothetical protein
VALLQKLKKVEPKFSHLLYRVYYTNYYLYHKKIKFNSSLEVESHLRDFKFWSKENTRYFTSDNELDGIENATHNTFATLTWIMFFDLKKC